MAAALNNAQKEQTEAALKKGAVGAARCGRLMLGAWVVFSLSVITDGYADMWLRIAFAASVPPVFIMCMKFMRGYYLKAAPFASALLGAVTGSMCVLERVDPLSLAAFLSKGVNPLSLGVAAACLLMYVFPAICFIIAAISLTADKNIKLFGSVKARRRRH